MSDELNELRLYKDRIESALEAGQIGIWTWLAEDDLLIWDKTMFDIYDVDESDFTGKYSFFEKRVHPEDRTAISGLIKDAMSNNGFFHVRFRIIDRNGNIRYIAGKGRVSADKIGNIKIMSGINFDVTKLVNVEKELERSNCDLEQFAYAISHDLQEPLRTISSFVDLLRQKNDFDAQSLKYIDLMDHSAKRMKRMIGDLLDYSKASPSPRGLKISTFDPNITISDACNLLRASIKETNAQIVTDAMPSISMNPSHLSQILQNLIDNALKYSKEGEISHIQIRCRESAKCWEFCVEDNGIGIDSRYQDKLFQLFQRIGPKSKHGSGIGLALCKRIVSIYGGRIWIRSELGKGTKVYFTIPKKMKETQYDSED